MARLLKNALVLLTNARVRHDYLRWCLHRSVGMTPTVRLADGNRILPSSKFNDFTAISRQHPGIEEIRLIRDNLVSNAIFVDVGANVGAYTCVAYRTAHTSRILAFEPSPRYCVAWYSNIELNKVKNATLVQAAATDHTGPQRFLMDPLQPLNNRLVSQITHGVDDRLTWIAGTTLDESCLAEGIDRIDFLKVDVEGAEPKVLRGARKLLQGRSIGLIYLEFIVEFMERNGEDPYEFARMLDDAGYELLGVKPDGTLGDSLDIHAVVDARRVAEDALEREFWELNIVARKRR